MSQLDKPNLEVVREPLYCMPLGVHFSEAALVSSEQHCVTVDANQHTCAIRGGLHLSDGEVGQWRKEFSRLTEDRRHVDEDAADVLEVQPGEIGEAVIKLDPKLRGAVIFGTDTEIVSIAEVFGGGSRGCVNVNELVLGKHAARLQEFKVVHAA